MKQRSCITLLAVNAHSSGEELRPWSGSIPALDGSRGLAILMVMLFHYCAALDRTNPVGRLVSGLFGYGWTGVDLFFVLSGFLITGILLDSREAENYFSSFYARRVLRIFPAYYASLAVLLFLVPLIDPPIRQLIPADQWIYVFYAQNWVGVFDYPGRGLFTPYWSLAVEEQFYLVWPLVIARVAGRRLAWTVAALCVSAVSLRFLGLAVGASTEAIYTNTLARMDSLLIGAGCAIAVRDPRLLARFRRHARWLWLAPVVPMLLIQLFLSSRKTVHPAVQGIGYTVIALSYAGLLLGAVLRGNPLLERFLCSRPMRTLGKYSYAAYIWHFVVMRLVRKAVTNHVRLPGPLTILLMISTTLLISLLSYHLVERWFLLLKKRFEPRFAPAAAWASGEPLPQAAQKATGA